MASAPPQPAPRSRFKRIIITGLKVFAYLLVISLVALGVAVAVAVSQLPSYGELVRRDDLGQMIRVRAANGQIIHTMGPSFGEWLPYERIPPVMRDAMIAVEDRRFRSHPGVDPIGMVRALGVRFSEGRWRQGGSTITQQLARNIFLNNDRTFARKIREGILALALEWRFSKDQILELYLNRVYFGGGAYGIDAASRRFFGHSATRLSVGEAAIIAGLVKAPSNYSPTADLEAAREPRPGRARPDGAKAARSPRRRPTPPICEDIQLARGTERQNSTRYFIDWVLPQLDTLIDETSAPIDVWTTIDPNMQRAADAAINANAPRGAQGALITLDRDGAVRAMVGGRDYVNSSYNRATQANRQPGSSFKLFVYLTALEAGYRPDTIVQDAPITIDGWSPRNDNGRNVGPIPMRVAFAYSVNTVAVRLAQQVGTRAVADMAQRFGITTRINTNPSMALGSSVGAADRHDPGLCLGGARRRRGDALRHPTGDHRRRHPALPAPGRRGARAGRALGGGADDRIAPGRRRARHRARRRSSAGRPRARPAPPRRTRTAGSSAFRAGSPPASGWAATTIARCRAFPAAAPRPAPSTISWSARSPTGRSSRSPPTSRAPNGRCEGDNEIWFAPPDDQPLVDADGNPIEQPPPRATRPGRRPDDAIPPDEEEIAARTSTGRRHRAAATTATPRRGRQLRRLARADAVEGGALALQPGPRRPRIGAEQLRDQGVEFRAVIEVDEMRDLVRDGGAADEVRREDQPPAVADRAPARAAAPARDRIADADPRRRDAGLAAHIRESRASSRASASAFSQRRIRRSSPVGGPARDEPARRRARSAAAAPASQSIACGAP